MKKYILFILMIIIGIVFILPWWGIEEELTPIEIDTTHPISIVGSFSGILPCADCGGIKTTLTLNKDNTYELVQDYDGRGTFAETGNWQLIDNQTEIHLKQSNLYLKIVKNGAQILNKRGTSVDTPFDMFLKRQ